MLFLPYYELEEVIDFLNKNDISDKEKVISIQVASKELDDKLLVDGISCGSITHNQLCYTYENEDVRCDTREVKWIQYSEDKCAINEFTISHLVCNTRHIIKNIVRVECVHPTAIPTGTFLEACKSIGLSLEHPMRVEDEFSFKNNKQLKFQ